MAKEIKTNVMRVLDKAKIEYNHYDYSKTGSTVGTEIAEILGLPVGTVLSKYHRAIKKMREAGEDIPELKRGPKCRK